MKNSLSQATLICSPRDIGSGTSMCMSARETLRMWQLMQASPLPSTDAMARRFTAHCGSREPSRQSLRRRSKARAWANSSPMPARERRRDECSIRHKRVPHSNEGRSEIPIVCLPKERARTSSRHRSRRSPPAVARCGKAVRCRTETAAPLARFAPAPLPLLLKADRWIAGHARKSRRRFGASAE